MIKQNAFFPCLAFVLLCGINNLFAASFVQDGQTITHDPQNFAVFRDIGRRGGGQSITFGKYPALVTHRGDEVTTTTLKKGAEEGVPVSSEVTNITYQDANHLWIISHLGGRLDGAILLNVKNQKIIEKYWGQNFKISPDGSHLAFSYPDGRYLDSVYVNHTMVYPLFNVAFDSAGPDGLKNEKGITHQKIIAKTKQGQLCSPLVWDGAILSFVIDENENDHGNGYILRRYQAQNFKMEEQPASRITKEDLKVFLER